MAFKTGETLDDWLKRIKGDALQVKRVADSYATRFASDTEAFYILECWEALKRKRASLDEARQVPGIAQYAKDQYNDQAYDPAAEFVTMFAALDAATGNIESTFPTDANGYLLARQLDTVNGDIDQRVFAAASLSTLRGLLQTLSATIE